MVACIVIAGLISIFSIFSFFGDAFSNTGGVVVPNMFDLMFGGTTNYMGYSFQWKQFGGMTFLFVLQIIIMLIALLVVILILKDENNSAAVGFGILTALIAVVAAIVSFCTLAITDIGNSVHLGFGPIFYSIIQLLSALLYFVGASMSSSVPQRSIYSSRLSSDNNIPTSSISTSTQDKTSDNREAYMQKLRNSLAAKLITKDEFYKRLNEYDIIHGYKKPQEKEVEMSEKEKIDLLERYKALFDKGVINKEEYEEKKRKLL